MRSLTSGIAGQLTQSGAFEGVLLEITLNTGQVLRFTSLDIDFTWNSFTWISRDIQLPQLSWDGTILKPGRLILADADLSFWVLAIGSGAPLADAGVRLYIIYAAASGEAEPVWSGRIAQIARNGQQLAVEITLTNLSDTQLSPRVRVQNVVNPQFLIPGGTVLNVGGQTWTLVRPTTAAG